jgi:hypothetical protein
VGWIQLSLNRASGCCFEYGDEPSASGATELVVLDVMGSESVDWFYLSLSLTL